MSCTCAYHIEFVCCFHGFDLERLGSLCSWHDLGARLIYGGRDSLPNGQSPQGNSPDGSEIHCRNST